MISDRPFEKSATESSVGIDAEVLGALRSLLSNASPLAPLFSSLIKFDFVVDANIIGADLRYLVEHPEARFTRLQEIAASGLFELHIPHWAISELENSTLSQIEEIHGVSETAMLERLDPYLESFTIHEAYRWPAVPVRAEADGKDEPYAALARDIHASAILSRDTDIEAFGAVRLDIEELIIARLFARAKAASLSMQFAGVSITGLSIWSAIKLVSYIWQRSRALPAGLQLALGAGLAMALTSAPAKRAARELQPVLSDIYHLLRKAVSYAHENDQLAEIKLQELRERLTGPSTHSAACAS